MIRQGGGRGISHYYSLTNPMQTGPSVLYWWFSQGTPISSTNKTDNRDITEILLKMALNTITPNCIFKEHFN